MSVPEAPGPRRYRVRVFEPNGFELLRDRRFPVTLDLDDPTDAASVDMVLGQLMRGLVRQLGHRGRPVPDLRLQVHEWPNGAKLLDWFSR